MNIGKLNNKDKHKALQKLHRQLQKLYRQLQKLHRQLQKLYRQFAHPSEAKMKTLLMDANVWDDDLKDARMCYLLFMNNVKCAKFTDKHQRGQLFVYLWLQALMRK